MAPAVGDDGPQQVDGVVDDVAVADVVDVVDCDDGDDVVEVVR